AARFELKKTANGELLFNLKAGNGEIILTSERYKTKPGALNGIDSVRNNATDAHRLEPREAANGQPYFVLKATHGDIIGYSELYSSGQGLEKGIASVQQNAPAARVDDLTAR
ncbi:MAG TPA: YegP family protein, partial [Candidatus Competibacteraceae bacterium]|nr:YegP family protein [Candidatus Competibacteraceae bacterium]